MIFDTWEDYSRPGIDDGSYVHFPPVGQPFYTSGLPGEISSPGSGFAPSPSKSLHSTSISDALFNSSDSGFLKLGTSAEEPGLLSDDVIVVTGERNYRFALPDWWYSNGGGGDGGGWFDGGGGGGGGGPAGDPPPLPDEATIDVQVMIDRPLTADEQRAIDNLKLTIEKLTAAINALADNAIVTLPNGADVTGAELKQIWAKTDFIINDNSVAYSNGGQGEALMAFGQPTISFNIGYLDQYDDLTGGMNYLVAHELGHLTQAGTTFYSDQRTANDIARALLGGAGLDYIADPGFGYTPSAPAQFSAPPLPSGGDSGDGGSGGGTGGGSGGGGGGWEVDQPV